MVVVAVKILIIAFLLHFQDELHFINACEEGVIEFFQDLLLGNH